MSPSDGSEHSVGEVRSPPTGGVARERSDADQETSLSNMERVLEALTRLETRMDTMERASVSVSNSSPVSPRMQHAQPGRRANGRNVAQAAFAGSEFRRAIDGGSALGRTPMQIDELSGMRPFGAGSFYRRAKAQGRVNQGAAEAQAALQAQVAAQAQAAYQAQAHYQPAPSPTPYADPGYLLGLGGQRVPNARDSKLMIRKFNGVEQYKGLGTGFCQWALLFLEAIEMAELGCGYQWTERVKANKLQQHLEGKALQYYQAHIEGWWMRNQSIAYLLEQLWLAFKVNISHHEAVHLYGAKKDSSRSWTEHLLYLTALMHSSETSEKLVLESVMKYAAPHMKVAIMGRYDPGRADYLHHAQELVAWAQEIEDDDRPIRNHAKGVVNAVGQTRKCFTCGKPGHIARECKSKKKKDSVSVGEKTRWALAAHGDAVDLDHWILDSGASRHLVRDVSMLEHAVDCDETNWLLLPNGERLQVTKKGTVTLVGVAEGKEFELKLSNVYFAPLLSRNLISFGMLAKQGCRIESRHGGMVIAKGSPSQVVFHLRLEASVLVANLRSPRLQTKTFSDIVMSAVVGQPLVSGFQEGTLMDFHGRFGHLSFDTIERMAREPESGIKLTDLRRVNCQICAEGKATKSRQPLRDSGTNLPIDRVGGVICSDLKGPITPLDRHGNRYLVNFVDHKTNYVRVSAGKTKDQATKKLDHFLVFFEKHFDCRVHVLRTDGGGEYANVDLLCNRQGVARQVSEAANQASNGKAERMHQTIMNMVRCMIFGSGIALTFWSDAADYAAYILNRSPTRANANRESPLELLTGQVPDLTDIVVFGSPCMVFRDTKKKNFKRHAVRGYIIGKNDETKGYKVLLSKDRKVTTTRHISTIETLGAAANEQIRQALKKLGVDELKRTKNGYSTVVAGGDNARDSSAVSKEELDGLRSARNAKKTAEGSKLRRSMRKKKKSRRQIEADDDEEEVLPPEAEPHLMVLAVVEGSANTPIAPEVEYGPDPKSYREARRDPHSDLWEQAEVEELRSLKANETWTLIKCEPGAKRLHTK